MVSKKEEVKEAFKTSDLNLSAYLNYSGFKFLSLPALERGLTIFTFEKSKELTQAVADYQSRNTTVDALTLFERQRVIKSYVWDFRKGRVTPEVAGGEL